MKSEVAQSCPTLCSPVDCSLPGSSIHGIFQARVLEWGAISFSRGSSWPGDWTWVTHCRQTFYHLSHQRSQKSIKESSILRWNYLYVEFGQALLEIKREIKYTFSVMQRLRPPWVAQPVKSLPAIQEIWVRSLSWEDPLEKGMATNSSILAWKNPMDRGACPHRNSPMTEFIGSQRVGHDWAASLSFFLRLRLAQNLQVQSKWIIGTPGWASGWEVHLPVRTRSLLWEGSTCCGAAKLSTTTAEPTLSSLWAAAAEAQAA